MQASSPAQSVARLCSELVRRLRLLERTELACCGVPLSRAMVVQALDSSGGSLQMSEVAAALGVAQSTATRLVDPLVKEGLVTRQSGEQDGRVVVAALSPRGRSLATELAQASQRWAEGLLARIPAGEHREVLAALEVVVGAVQECCAESCGSGISATAGEAG